MAGIRPAPTADSMGTCGDAWLWVLPQLRDSGSSPMRNDPAHMGRPSPGCRCLLQRLRRLRTEPGVRPGSWMGTQDTLDGPTLHPRPSDTYLEVAPVAPTTQSRSSGTDTGVRAWARPRAPIGRVPGRAGPRKSSPGSSPRRQVTLLTLAGRRPGSPRCPAGPTGAAIACQARGAQSLRSCQ